jgi:dUTP pyrophosphatase
MVVTVTRFPSLRPIPLSMTDASATKKRRMSPEAEQPVAPVSTLLIKRLSEKARLPTRGSSLAAGYDLYR